MFTPFFLLGVLSLIVGIILLDLSFRRRRRRELLEDQINFQKMQLLSQKVDKKYTRDYKENDKLRIRRNSHLRHRYKKQIQEDSANSDSTPSTFNFGDFQPDIPNADYSTWSDNSSNDSTPSDNSVEFGGGDSAGGGAGGDY